MGGRFADNQLPAVQDTITAYGKLGFGMAGYRACPGGGEFVQYGGDQNGMGQDGAGDHGGGIQTPAEESGEIKAVYQ